MRALYVLSFVSISFNKTYNGNAYDRVCKMKCVRWGVYNGNAYDGLHPSLMNCALSGLVWGVRFLMYTLYILSFVAPKERTKEKCFKSANSCGIKCTGAVL